MHLHSNYILWKHKHFYCFSLSSPQMVFFFFKLDSRLKKNCFSALQEPVVAKQHLLLHLFIKEQPFHLPQLNATFQSSAWQRNQLSGRQRRRQFFSHPSQRRGAFLCLMPRQVRCSQHYHECHGVFDGPSCGSMPICCLYTPPPPLPSPPLQPANIHLLIHPSLTPDFFSSSFISIVVFLTWNVLRVFLV